MGMALPMGGHLTHGWDVSITGKWFRSIQYGVRRDTGRVDLDEVQARDERAAEADLRGTAIPRTLEFAAFAEIAREVGAILVADIAHRRANRRRSASVAGRARRGTLDHHHKTLRAPRAMLLSDAEHAPVLDRAVFPGPKGPAQPHHGCDGRCPRRGARAAVRRLRAADDRQREDAGRRALGAGLRPGLGRDRQPPDPDRPNRQGRAGQACRQGTRPSPITTNYNTVPFDPRKPFDPSGIRIGTPAVTTRGMGAEEMEQIAIWIDEVVGAAEREMRNQSKGSRTRSGSWRPSSLSPAWPSGGANPPVRASHPARRPVILPNHHTRS